MAERLEFKGDYMGFTYNGVHSSELGIVRTSNGSRFDENLLPTIQDKTVQVPGGDGTYYFGSYYTQRQISVSYAFDGLTQEQVEKIKRLFGDKKIHELVFDELPYKAYSAKVTGTASLKYIPFDEGETHRLYKGEGTVQFTCYQPFAVCTKKYLSEYSDKEYSNKVEWTAASGLLEVQGDFDKLVNGKIALYNPGAKETDWRITINTQDCSGYVLKLGQDGANGLQIFWGSQVDSFPAKLILDSKTGLVLGEDGNLYNEYLTAGDFFKIPTSQSQIEVLKLDSEENEMLPNDDDVTISYNYYYF